MKKKLVYIMAAPRSGSTILDTTLGSIAGFFSLGEASFLWERGIEKNMYCGCRKRFNGCEFWKKVLEVSSINTGDVDPMKNILRSLSVYKILVLFGINTRKIRKAQNNLQKLYCSLFNTPKCKILIDSSKWPIYALLLSKIFKNDLYIINLVRDPRAVVHSWSKRKNYEPFFKNSIQVKKSLFNSVIEYNVWNLVSEIVKKVYFRKVLLIHYEDFAANPQKTINSILTFINERKKSNPVKKDNLVILRKNHCVSGNPARFTRGLIKIRPDINWSKDMDIKKVFLTTLFTFPWVLYYKYPIFINKKQNQ